MVNFSLSTPSSAKASKLTYSVVIDQEQDGKFSAFLLGASDYKSSGETEDEAVSKLRSVLQGIYHISTFIFFTNYVN